MGRNDMLPLPRPSSPRRPFAPLHRLLPAALLAAAGLLAPSASAIGFDGGTVNITASYNGGPAEMKSVTVNLTSGGYEVTSVGGFSWMIPGDRIDIFSTEPDRLRFEVFLSANHSPLGGSPQTPLFADDATLDFTVELPSTWVFQTSAITKAISLQATASTASHGFTAHLYGLENMTGESAGFDGKFELLTIFPSPPDNSVPDHGATLGLMLVGLALVGAARFRRSAS